MERWFVFLSMKSTNLPVFNQPLFSLITTLLCVGLFGLFGPTAFSQTPVSGGIFSNTTWTLANSPYLMTSNVVVFPGVTLTIEPGVEVRVASSPSPAAAYYLEARGTVNMVGQPGLPIRFRSDTALTTIGAWEGFRINDPQGGAVNFGYVELSNANTLFYYFGNSPSNLVVEGCTFNYNYSALNVGLSLDARRCNFKGNNSAVAGWSQFKFSQCVFDSNAVALSVYPASLEIDSCVFTRNAGALVLSAIPINLMSIRRSYFENNATAITNPGNGTIDSCVFFGNQIGITGAVQATITNSEFRDHQSAIQLGFGCTVRDCNISDNQTGVVLGPFSFGQPVPLVENNRICNNSLYNVENQTDLNLYLATNCFCLSDSVQVEAKLLDGYDDITKGLISYALFDTSCLTVLRVINKFTVSGIANPIQSSMAVCRVIPEGFIQLDWDRPRDLEVRAYSLEGKLVHQAHPSLDQYLVDTRTWADGVYVLLWLDTQTGESGLHKVRVSSH